MSAVIEDWTSNRNVLHERSHEIISVYNDHHMSMSRLIAENGTIINGQGNEEDHENVWALVIGFSLAINMATLVGVIFLIPIFCRKARSWMKSMFWNNDVPKPQNSVQEDNNTEKDKGSITGYHNHLLDVSIPSFASGALIATSIFLVIPEALYLIQKHFTSNETVADPVAGARFLEEPVNENEEHHDEFNSGTVWRFGSSLIGGFMLPMILDALFPREQEHVDGEACVDSSSRQACELDDEEHQIDHDHADRDGEIKSKYSFHNRILLTEHNKRKHVNWGLVLSVLLGDSFHNFCDGVFVGVGLTLCEKNTAYTMVAITLYHEVAQELADYFLLTKHAGLRPWLALCLNFISGLSVMIGGLVVLAVAVSDLTIGVILSIASGVYLYIASCECLPRVSAVIKSRKDRLISLLTFVFGVVPIGLALLNHSHCESNAH